MKFGDSGSTSNKFDEMQIIGFNVVFKEESFEGRGDFSEDWFSLKLKFGPGHFWVEIDSIHDAFNKNTGLFVGAESLLDSVGLGKQLDKSSFVKFLFVFLFEYFFEMLADDAVQSESANIRETKIVFDENGLDWFWWAIELNLFVFD